MLWVYARILEVYARICSVYQQYTRVYLQHSMVAGGREVCSLVLQTRNLGSTPAIHGWYMFLRVEGGQWTTRTTRGAGDEDNYHPVTTTIGADDRMNKTHRLSLPFPSLVHLA